MLLHVDLILNNLFLNPLHNLKMQPKLLKYQHHIFLKFLLVQLHFLRDFDIFRPFPSTTNPCDRIDSNGAFPLVPQDSNKDE